MSNEDQVKYWNGEAGRKWVTEADRLDAMLAPYAEIVLETAALAGGEQVVDVGCGAGVLTLAATAAVDEGPGALGIDISEPLLALARHRAEQAGSAARFAHGDASVFTPDVQADVVLSRFGVMFFDDPVAAFANILGWLRPGGRMVFACWQALALNEWALAPLQSALPLLPSPLPQPDPDAPGPFAFHDRDRLAAILAQAGGCDVAIDPFTLAMPLPGGSVEESAAFMMRLGPLSRLLAEQSIDEAPVLAALVDRLGQHAGPDGRIAMNAAVWIASARRGD